MRYSGYVRDPCRKLGLIKVGPEQHGDEARRIAANIAKLPELQKVGRVQRTSLRRGGSYLSLIPKTRRSEKYCLVSSQ
jgi:hypothetical protein